MAGRDIQQRAAIPADQVSYLIATATRAPSVHNTQPWRFRVGAYQIGLYADPGRKLGVDPAGREMLISCGAALFGLRLAVRSLGFQPVVDLLPDPARPRLLARVRLGAAEPITAAERQMLEALPHRHTHRGPFAPGPLPAGLLADLQDDALAEGASLALVEGEAACQQLADIAAAAARQQDLDQAARDEVRQWSRDAADGARDGVPATAFPARAEFQPGTLPPRDFGLGRGPGLLPAGGSPAADGAPPAATAVLVTPADDPADWLRAGQALHRLLAHAAARWVFASLQTQPLEIAPARALIRDRLALAGEPQMLLQLGLAHATHATARRPAGEVIET